MDSKFILQAAKIAELARQVDDQARSNFNGGTEKDSLIRCLRDMLHDVSGPVNSMIQMTSTSRVTHMAIRVLIHFNVPRFVPTGGSVSTNTISLETGIEQTVLERLFRFLITQSIFDEIPPGSGQISHTHLSRTLSQLSPWIALHLGPLTILPDLSLPNALESSMSTKETTAAELAFGQNWWDALEQRPDSIGTDGFHEALNCFIKANATGGSDPIASIYNWQELPKGTFVVDVGGGQGQTMVEVAKQYSHIRCIIQDLEMNRVGAERGIPEELTGRVTFETHDFFTPQNLKHEGATIFLLKWILHDWSDLKCEQILKHLIPFLRHPASHLLIVDFVLPDQTESRDRLASEFSLGFHAEAQIRSMDLTMLPVFGSGSRERSISDFRNLCQQADERLKIEKILKDTESHFTLLDVTLQT